MIKATRPEVLSDVCRGTGRPCRLGSNWRTLFEVTFRLTAPPERIPEATWPATRKYSHGGGATSVG